MNRGIAILLLLCFAAVAKAGTVTIETASDDADEIEVAEKVLRLIDEYELANWMFTDQIIVDREARIPHSHPVLTLTTRYKDDQTELLSNIIHEQLHWFVLQDQSALGAAIDEVRERYPDAPDGPPAGARDLRSTLCHRVVCSLEYLALERKLGRDATEKLLLSKPYYTWVFSTVVQDREVLREILTRNGIVLP